MTSNEKERWIAFSSYCKENELSISKDFDIENQLLPRLFRDDFKTAGYKFKESVLKKIVPNFEFKKVVKRPVKPKELYIFTPDENDNLFIFLWTNDVSRDRRAIEIAISSLGLIEKPVVNRSVNVIQSLRTLSGVVYSNAVDDDVKKGLLNNGHKNIDVFTSINNELVTMVYNSL